MVHIVDLRIHGVSVALELTARQRQARVLARAAQRNPLRRSRLACCGWVRNQQADVGEWVWCASCSDHRRVTELAA